MSFNLVFREIMPFTQDELKVMENMLCMEILDLYSKVFFCTCAEAAQYEGEYKEILKYCTKISTVDGVSGFIAKSNFHCYKSEESIYKHLADCGNAEFRYVDITKRCGEYIRWRNGVTEEMDEWQIPNVSKGAYLFYIAMAK